MKDIEYIVCWRKAFGYSLLTRHCEIGLLNGNGYNWSPSRFSKGNTFYEF